MDGSFVWDGILSTVHVEVFHGHWLERAPYSITPNFRILSLEWLGEI